jgi:DNA/RNA-binding domain of Phe-tRNA-synthetase-like protein
VDFIAQQEIFTRFPGMRLAVVIADEIDNAREHEGVAATWRAAWRDAAGAASYGNAQSHPRVQPWRERFRAMGVSGKEFPSSVEALLRRAMKGGEPFQINPLVDFYNAVSLRHVCPAGAFDLDDIAGPLELRLTRTGDTFLALDTDEELAVPPGEVAYAFGSTILTRHFVWRQARRGLVTHQTRRAFVVSEIIGDIEEDVAHSILNDFRQGIESWFGQVTHACIVDALNPSTSW